MSSIHIIMVFAVGIAIFLIMILPWQDKCVPKDAQKEGRKKGWLSECQNTNASMTDEKVKNGNRIIDPSSLSEWQKKAILKRAKIPFGGHVTESYYALGVVETIGWLFGDDFLGKEGKDDATDN